jgi:hypothetical protein
METPVALIIFNRPATTARVFQAIAAARPKQLLVIADGPRADRPGEAEKCAAARAVVEGIDWNCDLLTNYSDLNLGVGIRPATGLSWVFERVEQAIVLEDDCLPHPTFFRYCEELLDKYRDDERVMHISGDNWNFGEKPFSYFFSCYCYSCGWATWRRAFQHYDPTVKLWPALRDTPWLMDILGDHRAAEFWAGKFDANFASGIEQNGWDWPWLFACWAHRGLSILPSTNLITNIGFSADATHTRDTGDERANVPAVEMPLPLRHPPCMVRDTDADRRIFEQVSHWPGTLSLYARMRRRCAAALPASVRASISPVRSLWNRPGAVRE